MWQCASGQSEQKCQQTIIKQSANILRHMAKLKEQGRA